MKKNPGGAIFVLIATVIAFLGLCLPFYKVDAFGEEISASLIYADGISVVGVLWGIFAVLTLLFALIGLKIPALIFGILTSGGLFLSYFKNNVTLNEYELLGAFVKKGAGNTLCIIGAVVMFIASIIYMVTTKSKREATA